MSKQHIKTSGNHSEEQIKLFFISSQFLIRDVKVTQFEPLFSGLTISPPFAAFFWFSYFTHCLYVYLNYCCHCNNSCSLSENHFGLAAFTRSLSMFPLVATTYYFSECLKNRKTMFTCVCCQFYTLYDFLPNSVHTFQQSRSQEFESGWAKVM